MFDTPLAQRKLRILNALFHARAGREHGGRIHDRHGELNAGAIVGSTWVGITLEIAGRHRTVLARGYQRPAPDLPASTPLVLSVDGFFAREAAESWRDEGSNRIEAHLAEVTAAIIVAGERGYRRGLKEAEEREEQFRLQQEQARRDRQAAIDAGRLEELRHSGELLRQADDIRALVARLTAAVHAGDQEVDPARLAQWAEWAMSYADRLDPVRSGQLLAQINGQD